MLLVAGVNTNEVSRVELICNDRFASISRVSNSFVSLSKGHVDSSRLTAIFSVEVLFSLDSLLSSSDCFDEPRTSVSFTILSFRHRESLRKIKVIRYSNEQVDVLC